VQLNDATHERKAEPDATFGSVERPIDLCERIEDPFEHLWSDADAGVGDGDDRGAMIGTDVDRDRAAARRVLDRVRQDIGENLVEPFSIALDTDERLGRPKIEHEAIVPRPAFQRVERVADDLDEIDDFAL